MNEIPLKKTGLSRVIAAFFYSLAGIRSAFSNEAAFRQEAVLYLVLLPAVALLPIDGSMKCVLLVVNTNVLIAELLNSAVEAVVDIVSTDFHPLAKRAKDMGSGAVLLCLIVAALTWIYSIVVVIAK